MHHASDVAVAAALPVSTPPIPLWLGLVRLTRLDKPIGWLLLLWPTWWGLWAAAGGMPSTRNLVIFTLGVIVMRSAGCVINDYADRWLDGQVKRTAARPLVTGAVTPKQALILFIALMALALLLVSFTNALTMKLSLIGAALAVIYPFIKRRSHLPQFWLGAAFGWSVPMAFAAEKGAIEPVALLLFLANVLWSTAYDTIYAMVDRDDDLKAGARSTAILFGDLDLIAIGILHASSLLALYFAGSRLQLAGLWYLGLALAALVIVIQHLIIRSRERQACFRAFRLSHWAGAAVWLGFVLGTWPEG